MVSVAIGDDDASHLYMVWDYKTAPSPPPPGVHQYSVVDTRWNPVAVRGNTRAHFAIFHPFNYIAEHENSLTVFSNYVSTYSLQFNNQTQLGRAADTCCAVTHYLRPGERIESLQLITKTLSAIHHDQGPYILVSALS